MILRRTQQPLLLTFLLCVLAASPCVSFLKGRQHLSRPLIQNTNVLLSMGVAKSGGKLMNDESEFAKNVLDPESTLPVMVFFTAPWCGPCRLSAPVVKDVMTEYKNQLYVVEVCTDDLPEVAAVAGVVSIPTIQMYFKGQLQDTIVGCVARQVLASSVAKVVEDTLGTDPDGEEEGKKEETLP